MDFPLAKLAKITDPQKLAVLQLINRVERNIPRRTEERAIRILLNALKESNPHPEDSILKRVA